jgi:hypothetical protein
MFQADALNEVLVASEGTSVPFSEVACALTDFNEA